MNSVYILLIFIICFIAECYYFKIADRFNIIDKPNERSSHKQITIRGGGIIFPFSIILYFLFFGNTMTNWEYFASFLLGLLSISIVSLWDDISSLPNKVRLLIHLVSVTLLIFSLGFFDFMPFWVIGLVYILIIGTINAFNFMDGINGITGLYSLVFLGTLYWMNASNTFTDSNFLLSAIMGVLVFLFFNFRKKAKCFAGDIGSVSIGFIILYLLISLVIYTDELKYILFIAVYGVDTVLTICHRLLLKQNIFEAHRLHFYQILANDQKIPHLTVSIIYAIVQLLVNVIIIMTDFNFLLTGLITCGPLAITYILLKRKLMIQPTK